MKGDGACQVRKGALHERKHYPPARPADERAPPVPHDYRLDRDEAVAGSRGHGLGAQFNKREIVLIEAIPTKYAGHRDPPTGLRVRGLEVVNPLAALEYRGGYVRGRHEEVLAGNSEQVTRSAE